MSGLLDARRGARAKKEPTIALINIVFLMLVFFMVAGTLSQPIDDEVRLVNTSDLDGSAPPDAVVIRADGSLDYRGDSVGDLRQFIEALPENKRAAIRFVPDRSLPAAELVRLANVARAAGAEKVLIVTERGLQ